MVRRSAIAASRDSASVFRRASTASASGLSRIFPGPLTGASVIVTGSTTTIKGTPAFSVYSASKAALRSFVRNWILDVKELGIRINLLSPGPTKTPGLVELAGPDPAQQQGMLDHMASLVPMGRVGDPDEIAKVAVFLASDDASFITGTELFADGGQAQV